MKHLKVLTIVIALSALTKIQAQHIEISPIAGYNFDESFDIDYGEAKIGDGLVYGGILAFNVNPNYDVELLYTHQDATGSFRYYNIIEYYDNDIPVGINYIQIGGARLKDFKGGQVQGFGGLNLGAVWVAPDESGYDDAWRAAVGFKLGVKIWASERIGIRLQTNLQMPIQAWGGSIYVGTGGSGAGVSTYSTITQFGFTGGLTFKLGKSTE